MADDMIYRLIKGGLGAAGRFSARGMDIEEKAPAREALILQNQIRQRQLGDDELARESTAALSAEMRRRGGPISQKDLPQFLENNWWTPELVVKWIESGLVEGPRKKSGPVYSDARGAIIDQDAGTVTVPEGLPPREPMQTRGYKEEAPRLTASGQHLVKAPDGTWVLVDTPGFKKSGADEEQDPFKVAKQKADVRNEMANLLGDIAKVVGEKLYTVRRFRKDRTGKQAEKEANNKLTDEELLAYAEEYAPDLLAQYRELEALLKPGAASAPQQAPTSPYSKLWGD